MATKRAKAPRCHDCAKPIKGRVNVINNGYDRFGREALVCDKCWVGVQQCDICFNLTDYAHGAIPNHAENAGEYGDSIVCKDCRDVKQAADEGTLFDDTTDQWGNKQVAELFQGQATATNGELLARAKARETAPAKAPTDAPESVVMAQRIKALVGFEVRDSEGNLLGVFNQYGSVDWLGGAQ
jgi:hypothetical protein